MLLRIFLYVCFVLSGVLGYGQQQLLAIFFYCNFLCVCLSYLSLVSLFIFIIYFVWFCVCVFLFFFCQSSLCLKSFVFSHVFHDLASMSLSRCHKEQTVWCKMFKWFVSQMKYDILCSFF